LIYSKILESRITNRWEAPLIIGGCLAILSLTILLVRKIQINSIFLGINIYLITACSAILFNISSIQKIYENMTASAVIAWIVIIFTITVLINPSGFIGINHLSRKTILISYFCLLIAGVLALIISMAFKDNIIFSDFIPFAILFSTQKLLIFKFKHISN
jgi:hypothetical protein